MKPLLVADLLCGAGGSSTGCAQAPFHMPRWASRLTLEVTAVRIERLQEISEEDAAAEGVRLCADGDYRIGDGIAATDAIGCFSVLWWSLHGIGSWYENPEVVAISFRVHMANVDALLPSPEGREAVR